jgi:hypothetical protein
MKYLKLYESFLDELDLDELEVEDDIELSNITIDDFLNHNNSSYLDSNGIIHIKNWKNY